jgi:hypothetical protein
VATTGADGVVDAPIAADDRDTGTSNDQERRGESAPPAGQSEHERAARSKAWADSDVAVAPEPAACVPLLKANRTPTKTASSASSSRTGRRPTLMAIRCGAVSDH